MSSGSCSGPGVCGGARRRPPPPPEPALSLAADLSELSLDQGYHTLADCGPPRRRRDNTLNDALWLKILSYLEVGEKVNIIYVNLTSIVKYLSINMIGDYRGSSANFTRSKILVVFSSSKIRVRTSAYVKITRVLLSCCF